MRRHDASTECSRRRTPPNATPSLNRGPTLATIDDLWHLGSDTKAMTAARTPAMAQGENARASATALPPVSSSTPGSPPRAMTLTIVDKIFKPSAATN
jgi:hypothetical protein